MKKGKILIRIEFKENHPSESYYTNAFSFLNNCLIFRVAGDEGAKHYFNMTEVRHITFVTDNPKDL